MRLKCWCTDFENVFQPITNNLNLRLVIFGCKTDHLMYSTVHVSSVFENSSRYFSFVFDTLGQFFTFLQSRLQ